MVEKLVRWVVAGQALFLVMMGVCWAIEPSQTAVRRGLSFYGNEPRTVVPYTAGFVLAIGLAAIGLRRHREGGRRLRWAVGAVVALMIPIPLTPYRVDAIVDYLHIGTSAMLFASALAVGGWIALCRLRGYRDRALFGLQALAALAILTGQTGLHDYMIPSEVAFQLVMVVLVVLGMRRTGRPGLAAPHSHP